VIVVSSPGVAVSLKSCTLSCCTLLVLAGHVTLTDCSLTGDGKGIALFVSGLLASASLTRCEVCDWEQAVTVRAGACVALQGPGVVTRIKDYGLEADGEGSELSIADYELTSIGMGHKLPAAVACMHWADVDLQRCSLPDKEGMILVNRGSELMAEECKGMASVYVWDQGSRAVLKASSFGACFTDDSEEGQSLEALDCSFSSSQVFSHLFQQPSMSTQAVLLSSGTHAIFTDCTFSGWFAAQSAAVELHGCKLIGIRDCQKWNVGNVDVKGGSRLLLASCTLTDSETAVSASGEGTVVGVKQCTLRGERGAVVVPPANVHFDASNTGNTNVETVHGMEATHKPVSAGTYIPQTRN
jgi:hypothetical protein